MNLSDELLNALWDQTRPIVAMGRLWEFRIYSYNIARILREALC